MIPLWALFYGLAWIVWLLCVIGGLGNQKLLGMFSARGEFTPSEQYQRGLKLSAMGSGKQSQEEPRNI